MKQWHALFSTFLDPACGITWALSIIFLVVTVRLILFPLFVKQVKSQRAMQELQPEIAKLRKQYGSDRQGMSQAMMALQKERGVNPLAGCLPILPQIPIFLSLFHVLRRLAPGVPGALRLVGRADRPGGEGDAVRRPDLRLVQHGRRQGGRDPGASPASRTSTSASSRWSSS